MRLFNFNKDRYVVAFCIKDGCSYNFQKVIAIKPINQTVKYDKDHEFIIDIEKHSYRKNNTRYYCIDINTEQIFFEQLDSSDVMSSRITKLIMTEQIILQLAKATTTPIKQTYDWKTLIIGLVIGALIGFIIKIFIPIG